MADPIEGRLIFDNPTDEQLDHLRKAEAELTLAGVIFDSGSSVGKGKVLYRDWELDWSLKGARLVSSK